MYIGVYSRKGGVGKSTITKELALYLERFNKKCLIVDLDINNTITNSFKLVNNKNISDIESIPVEKCITKTKYIDILAGDQLSDTESLREKLIQVENLYEYIIVDTSVNSFEVLKDLDLIIIPTTCQYYSYLSLEYTIDYLRDLSTNAIIKAIFNRVEEEDTKIETMDKINLLLKRKEVETFNTEIREDETIYQVQFKNRELRTFDALSDEAEDIKNLAEEIIENKN